LIITKSKPFLLHRNLLETRSLQQLQLKGLCLLKLKIDHKYTGLYGRTIIVLATSVPGKIINTQHFSSGDIVSLTENSVPPSQLKNIKNLKTGTVTKVTSQTIQIAIDNDADDDVDDLDEYDTVYKIIKLANDVTHKRIKGAISKLNDAHSSKLNARTLHLRDVLFLKTQPQRSVQSITNDDSFTFYNKGLDESQQAAVKFTFEQNDLAIIHGPPGTGKTTTLIEIIKQNCLKFNQKILCCAPSNIAVDNLVERLIKPEPGYGTLKMIRLGHPARLLEHIQDYSLDSIVSKSDQFRLANDIRIDMDKTLKTLRKKTTQRGERDSLRRDMRELKKELYKREERAVKDVLQRADIILATLTTTHAEGQLRNIPDNHFDIIIIDECSQALEAACW
jgi:ATP-dependent RNA/DNA helicase IGHMBP2